MLSVPFELSFRLGEDFPVEPPPLPTSPPPTSSSPAARNPSRFEREAAAILSDLRQSIQQTLATLSARRPVDLQKSLKLDNRLSWQLFKVAGEKDALAAGSFVPARVSIEKFTAAAAKSGVTPSQIESVLSTFSRFEDLVERHTGDRNSFNSLISSARGVTEEWLAADLQHRRNMFRGMSHSMGYQARTRLLSLIITSTGRETPPCEFAIVSGYAGLRILRPRDRIRVHGSRLNHVDPNTAEMPTTRRPICLSDKLNGYLIDEFSSKPLPQLDLQLFERDWGHWSEINVLNPELGNEGVSDLFFGEVFRNATFPLEANLSHGMPVETSIFDILVHPHWASFMTPHSLIHLGTDHALDKLPDLLPLDTSSTVEPLGQGPEALATSEFPRYPDLLRSVATKLIAPNDADNPACSIEKYQAYRFRETFPIYQSNSRIKWSLTA